MKRFSAVIPFLLIATLSFASEKPVWIEAKGEAYMSEIDTPKGVRERAKRDAENRAIEKAVGAFIRAHTLVSNAVLAEDLIYASVRGKIDKIEIIKEGWDEKDRNLYRVFLKALIIPVYPERGEGLTIKLSLSKTHLKEGDKVKIFYQANEDCYVYIFSVAADGSVTLLLPNSLNPHNAVKGGKVYQFPEEGSKIHVQARFLPEYKDPVAEERIKVIATKKKEDLIPLGFQEGLFRVFDAKSTGMISDLVKRLNRLEPHEWAEDTVTYKIERY